MRKFALCKNGQVSIAYTTSPPLKIIIISQWQYNPEVKFHIWSELIRLSSDTTGSETKTDSPIDRCLEEIRIILRFKILMLTIIYDEHKPHLPTIDQREWSTLEHSPEIHNTTVMYQ